MSVQGGSLVFGTEQGRYEWYLREMPIGAPPGTEAPLFSTGTYRWDGETLSLVDDTAGLGPIGATVRGTSTITLTTALRRFEFARLVRLPPG